jgi:DNA-binding transcriptional MerR regulator
MGEAVAPPRKGGGRGAAARGLENRRKVLDLRVAGVTFENIGRQLKITKQAAHKHYRRAMAEAQQRTAELSDELTELTRRRLDALISAHWVSRADPRSAEVIIRVEALRMRLEGTEAPTRLQHTGPDGKPMEFRDGITDDERAARIAALLDRVGQRRAGLPAPGPVAVVPAAGPSDPGTREPS